MYHLLFSKLQIKNNAELLVIVNVFIGILTKELIKRAEWQLILVDRVKIENKIISVEYKEDVSNISEFVTNEPYVCFYSCATNSKD